MTYKFELKQIPNKNKPELHDVHQFNAIDKKPKTLKESLIENCVGKI